MVCSMLISLCNCTDLLFSTTCLSASSYILPVITSLLCSLLGINDIEIYILSILLQWGYTTAIPLVLTRKYPPKTQVWQVMTRRGFTLLAASKIGVRHDIEGGIRPTASNNPESVPCNMGTFSCTYVHEAQRRQKWKNMGIFFRFGAFVLACPAVK